MNYTFTFPYLKVKSRYWVGQEEILAAADNFVTDNSAKDNFVTGNSEAVGNRCSVAHLDRVVIARNHCWVAPVDTALAVGIPGVGRSHYRVGHS